MRDSQERGVWVIDHAGSPYLICGARVVGSKYGFHVEAEVVNGKTLLLDIDDGDCPYDKNEPAMKLAVEKIVAFIVNPARQPSDVLDLRK